MFKKLRQKWNVSAGRLAIILVCFALAGSLTGYTGRRIMGWLSIEAELAWWPLYIIIITLLWPLFVILIGMVFGQYQFFKNYLSRMGQRMRGKSTTKLMNQEERPTRIAIFASGAGSNADKIIEYFNNKVGNTGQSKAIVSLLVCNKPGAGVFQIAQKHALPVLLIEKEKFFRGNAYTDELKEAGIDFIVLAGFLWKMPAVLVEAYSGKILNIHPALLPKYGGKGMYGQKVHEAVILNKEKESGITIHWVDEQYDNGAIIFQASCPVELTDTPETLASRIHQLEHEHFPRVIESVL